MAKTINNNKEKYQKKSTKRGEKNWLPQQLLMKKENSYLQHLLNNLTHVEIIWVILSSTHKVIS